MTSYIIRPQIKKIPNILIYKRENVPFKILGHKPYMTKLYKMSDNGKPVGHMYSRVIRNHINDEIYPLVKSCDTFHIEELQIKKGYRRKGYGSKFLSLAKKESKAENCNGRVSLVATAFYDVYNPAHIFYRKKGFKSVYPEINSNIEECIASKDYTQHVFQSCYMYLPIGDKAPIPKRTKIKNFLMTFLNLKHKGEI